MNRKDRKLDYAHVIGELSAEGRITDQKTLKEALRLNPVSPIEKAMRAKTDKELQKIGNELEDAQNAFNRGYFEAMKKEPLSPSDIKELKRRIRLVNSGIGSPSELESQKLELKVKVLRLLDNGYKIPSDLGQQIQKLVEDV